MQAEDYDGPVVRWDSKEAERHAELLNVLCSIERLLQILVDRK